MSSQFLQANDYNKFQNIQNFSKTPNSNFTRGISLDNHKPKLVPPSECQFKSASVNTTHLNTQGSHLTDSHVEKYHSFSPNRIPPNNEFLLPPTSNPHQKTLVLDLDETLIHSSFQNFKGGADLLLKVIIT